MGFDPATGYVGLKVVSPTMFECTNFDKLLLMYKDGSYTVINIPEKQYVNKEESKVIYAGVADKETVMNVLYKDPKTGLCYAKRFVVNKFMVDKPYRFMEEGKDLLYLSSQPNVSLELQFVPKAKQKLSAIEFSFNKVLVKGVTAKGIRVTNRPVKKVITLKESEKAKVTDEVEYKRAKSTGL